MKMKNGDVTLITIALMVLLSLTAFVCGRSSATKMPDKYRFLPLTKVESVTETDDVVTVKVESGDYYTFKIDK